MKKIVCVVCLVLAWNVGDARLRAQQATTPAPPTFEVASVKPSDPNASSAGLPGGIPMARPQGRTGLSFSNYPLRLLVRMAYGLQDFQISGGPAWQMSNKFDIIVKAPEGTTQSTTDMLPMMKTLLTDRFKLKTHTESREMPVYELVVARSDGKLGSSLKPSTSDCSPANAAAEAQKRSDALAKGGASALAAIMPKPGETWKCAMMPAIDPANPSAGFGLRADGQPLTMLTQLLSQATGRSIVDKTGLKGLYDWELRFDPQVFLAMLPQLGINLPGLGANTNSPFADSPSLLTALQEQLGLKLDSQRGPVDVLVIDSAEMPEPD